MVLVSMVGIVGGCGCGIGSLLFCSGLGGLDWRGRFGCCVLLSIRALHCMRFSCAGAVVVFVGRVHCRLPVPAFSLVFG